MKTGDAATHREFESHTLRQKLPTPTRGSAIFIGEEIRKVKSDSPVDCRREAPASRTFIFAANAAKMQSNLHSPPASNQAEAFVQRLPRIPTDFRIGDAKMQSNLHSPLPPIKQNLSSNASLAYPPTFVSGTQKCNRISTLRPFTIKQKLPRNTASPYRPAAPCKTRRKRIIALCLSFSRSVFSEFSPRSPCIENRGVL